MRNIFTLLFLLFFTLAHAQNDGLLDNSWGNNGTVTATVGGSVASTGRQKLILLTSGAHSGYMLQSFTVTNSGTGFNDFGVARYDADGNLDQTFGTGGFTTIDFGGNDYATSMALQSDGKIIVSGYSVNTTTGRASFATARLTANGVLDNTGPSAFGTGGSGKVTTNLSDDDLAYSVLVQPDDKIIVGGSSGTITSGEIFSFGLVRYGVNGTLDAGFGTGGKVITTINGFDQINSIALQSNSKIVVAGFTNPSSFNFALARYNSNGTLDNTPGSFGTNGIAVADLAPGRDDYANTVVINSTGKIIAGGAADNGTNLDFALTQFTSTGALDPSFSSDGIVTTDFGQNDVAYDLTIENGSKLILMGRTYTGPEIGPGTDNDYAVARYLSNGTPDLSFGTSNGTNTVDFASSNDLGYSVALGPGYIMLGGVNDISGQGSVLGLARLTDQSVLLPVHLLTFTASLQNNSVVLNWQTVSEQNALRFEIEKSEDGRSFSKIGSVQAAGNSSSSKKYALRDPSAILPVNFYRLKIINLDQSFSYSKVVVVRAGEELKVEAFPNPVRSLLNLQFTQPVGKVQVLMMDVSGRTSGKYEFNSNGSRTSVSIDMTGLPNGIYFVRINNESIKVVKE
ncbi:MAG: T9SS type A sorting domain-containing protein [Flavisolibacter sp.]